MLSNEIGMAAATHTWAEGAFRCSKVKNAVPRAAREVRPRVDGLGDQTGDFERAGRERHIEASGPDAVRASDGAVRRAAGGGRGVRVRDL